MVAKSEFVKLDMQQRLIAISLMRTDADKDFVSDTKCPLVNNIL